MEVLKHAPEIIRGLFSQEARRELQEWQSFSHKVGRAVTGVNPRNPKDNHWPIETSSLLIHHWLEKFPEKSPRQKKIGLSELHRGLLEGIWERHDEGSPESAPNTFPNKGIHNLRTALVLIQEKILPYIGSDSEEGKKAMAEFAEIYMKRVYPVVPFNKIMPSLSIPAWMNIN